MAASFRRDMLEKELIDIEGQIDALKTSNKPVRHELERLVKRRKTIMRQLGLM